LAAEAPLPTDWRGSGTILLVDDDETVLAVGGMMLGEAGFEVRTAHDGREAVEIFRQHQDEIVGVVLDLSMPHMGGEETFRELRRIREDVKVVLSSGNLEQDATKRFAGKGLAGFVKKPYEVDALIGQLRHVLE
jgi:CheY-like chemotaxis protein